MTNTIILILILLISHFGMATFLVSVPSYGVYISPIIRFASVSSHLTDLSARNKTLNAKLLQQGYRYHKLRTVFSKLYRRHYELVSKYDT